MLIMITKKIIYKLLRDYSLVIIYIDFRVSHDSPVLPFDKLDGLLDVLSFALSGFLLEGTVGTGAVETTGVLLGAAIATAPDSRNTELLPFTNFCLPSCPWISLPTINGSPPISLANS